MNGLQERGDQGTERFQEIGQYLGANISRNVATPGSMGKVETEVLEVTRRKTCVLWKTLLSGQGLGHPKATPLSSFHLQGLSNGQPNSKSWSKQRRCCGPYRVTSHCIHGERWRVGLEGEWKLQGMVITVYYNAGTVCVEYSHCLKKAIKSTSKCLLQQCLTCIWFYLNAIKAVMTFRNCNG